MSNKVLRLPRVIELTGFSRSSIYKLMVRGQFPAAVNIGERAVAWVERDVEKWLAERITASRATPGNTAVPRRTLNRITVTPGNGTTR